MEKADVEEFVNRIEDLIELRIRLCKEQDEGQIDEGTAVAVFESRQDLCAFLLRTSGKADV